MKVKFLKTRKLCYQNKHITIEAGEYFEVSKINQISNTLLQYYIKNNIVEEVENNKVNTLVLETQVEEELETQVEEELETQVVKEIKNNDDIELETEEIYPLEIKTNINKKHKKK